MGDPAQVGGLAIANRGAPPPPAADDRRAATQTDSRASWLERIAIGRGERAARLASWLAYLSLAVMVLLEAGPGKQLPAIPAYYLLPVLLLAWFRAPGSAALAGGVAIVVPLALTFWRGGSAGGYVTVLVARLLTIVVAALLARGLGVLRRMFEFAQSGAAWRAMQGPVRIGSRLLVVPVLEAADRAASEKLGPEIVPLYLQPGLAFGSSSHPTTRMCLELMEGLMPPGARVLDVGCGTGILAIAAAKLGAAGVHAIDIDPEAVRTAHANLALNHVLDKVVLQQGSLDLLFAPDKREGGDGPTPSGSDFPNVARHQFDLVLANLLAEVIRDLLHRGMAQLLDQEGVLIASGIRSNELESTRVALLGSGLAIEQSLEQDGWWAVVGRSR